jgi:hypothetical protein
MIMCRRPAGAAGFFCARQGVAGMASKLRTSMYLKGHAYSLFDPEEIHRDMRTDLTQARLVLARNQAVVEAHENCLECRDIVEMHDRDAPADAPPTSYPSLDAAIVAHSARETKYVLTRANLARMLGLGPGERITRMFVTDDPQLLNVVIAAEHFSPVPDGAETPVSKVSRRG